MSESSGHGLTLICGHCGDPIGGDFTSLMYCSKECERAAWKNTREAAERLGLDTELPRARPFSDFPADPDPAKTQRIIEMDINEWVQQVRNSDE